MKIGIFFGGQSREREISFAGGRTVFDNLDKAIFEAVPVFVDSLGRFILLDWQYIYKGTIRDFYPPSQYVPSTEEQYQIYIESLAKLSETDLLAIANSVGKVISPQEFNLYMDFAFLALHGPYGEDGNLQGLLEWYNIPYSGSGILPSAIGINKTVQKDLMESHHFPSPKKATLTRDAWSNEQNSTRILDNLVAALGLPLVIKAPNQGSSIGVSILKDRDVPAFEAAVNRSFFIKHIDLKAWQMLPDYARRSELISLIDIREGIGLPAIDEDQNTYYTPQELIQALENAMAAGKATLALTSINSEEEILIESYIAGKEFSCIVIQDEAGQAIALPPTEIVKGSEVFDYRSKYLPGVSRKVTPIRIAAEHITNIRQECARLFDTLHCNVYARIDGFITEKNEIFLNDPNTTSGMLPSSFFFHQAAEIGLNPSQFLSYIIRTSLVERIKTGKRNQTLRAQLAKLDAQLKALHEASEEKIKVAVIMGGFSSERHISVESGRNIYEKLSSSTKYHPIPVFLTGNEEKHELYKLPVNIMLKDNADDIKEKIAVYDQEKNHPVLKAIVKETEAITQKYVAEAITSFQALDYKALASQVDLAFIALHGRPGEDGAVQQELEKYNIPYNGSGYESSQTTINKFETNRILRENGVKVADHFLVSEADWQSNSEAVIAAIESRFNYPIIAKPCDDGCSSAVKKLKNKEELSAFAHLIFRKDILLSAEEAALLKLKRSEEFPLKNVFLVEELIDRKDAAYFLEITGGLLTHFQEDGSIAYEIFEPSETLATGDVLSLEEKFLAGEGQNITPARFVPGKENQSISKQVRAELEKVAKILNVEGYARIDAFVRIDKSGKVDTYIIEVNSLPGMTPATCIFHQCAINNYKPYEFIDAILDFGTKRSKDRIQANI